MIDEHRYVVLLKGISGSGKSTFANIISHPKSICSADDYFTDEDGNYNFDATKLGWAHQYCKNKFDDAVRNPNVKYIVVDNTNCNPSDYRYYEIQAKEWGLRVMYVVLEKRHDNENCHGVPESSLQRQYDNLKVDLKLK